MERLYKLTITFLVFISIGGILTSLGIYLQSQKNEMVKMQRVN